MKVYIRNLNVPGRIETGMVTESMRFVIMSNATVGRTFRLPFPNTCTLPTTLTVDWGDNSEPETFAAGTAITAESLTHTYADSDDGDHTITLTVKYAEDYTGPRIPYFNFSNRNDATKKNMLKGLPDPILKIDSQWQNDGPIDFGEAFYQCVNLTYICGNLFSKNPEVADGNGFTNTFMDCRSLTGPIPEDLFSYCPQATMFQATFAYTKVTGSIPGNLFANNPDAKSFQQTFSSCTKLTGPIPEQLFAYNTKATNFESTFENCSGLTSIPENLFANCSGVTTFRKTFASCTAITSIPERLFVSNPKVKRFWGTFHSTSITAIPAGLFASNTMATDFGECFLWCTKLKSIPNNLFYNNTLATNFSRTFDGTSITSIPEELFSRNTKATNFKQTFQKITTLRTRIPAKLFQNTAATDFSWTFYECTNLPGPIPKDLFKGLDGVTTFYNTFSKCKALSGSIPAGLFATNTKVTNFKSTFEGCTKLAAVRDIFIDNDNTADTRFSGVSSVDFSNCFKNLGTGLTSSGTAPDLWNYSSLPASVTSTGCFSGGNYTNSSDIPEGWK